MIKQQPVFDYLNCVSCGICAQACPVSALEMKKEGKSGKYRNIFPELLPGVCIGCGQCAASCPMEVIRMEEVERLMRVKILPPHGSDRRALDERSWAELPEGSTVRDVLKLIRCNPAKARLLLVSVNGERCPLSREFRDGDVVGFFFPVSGG